MFGEFEHMGEVAYPCRLIVAYILDFNIHVGVLAFPPFEYNSSILRPMHTLEATFVGCIICMTSSLEDDGIYSLRWIWGPRLYCNCLREINFERQGFVMSLLYYWK